MSIAPSHEVADDALIQAKPPFLRRVRIRGYKSIAFCDVTLEPLTILVGRNASGKSNFLDALAFLRDVVGEESHEAVKLHGGRDAVLCRLTKSALISVEIDVGFQPPGEAEPWFGSFAVEIALPEKGQPRVVREQARIGHLKPVSSAGYLVEGGRVTWHGPAHLHTISEWAQQDKVFLGVTGVLPFLELREGIESIETYNFNPEAIRRPQKPAPGWFLERDGSNLASVIETTREVEEWAIERAGRYLRGITKTTGFAGVVQLGGYETLSFRVAHDDDAKSLEFPAASMSDGTLRTFAALVAAFQMTLPQGSPSVVAIEEPETSLHPAATAALVDALDEATLRTQILLTTHSADMLDNPMIKPENLRVVQLVDGKTVIGPVDEASVEIIARKLSRLGGLARENQLEPDYDDQERQQHLSRNGAEPRMTLYIVPIVEGQTEQGCVERLLHRVWYELLGQHERVQVVEPYRGHRDELVHPDGLVLADTANRALVKLRAKAKKDAQARPLVLILLDAESDCPQSLAPRLLAVARKALPTEVPVSCVLAKRMLENWIVAGASALAGVNGLPDPLPARDQFEDRSGVAWLATQLRSKDKRRKYRKTDDAEPFIRAMDLQECRDNAPSFDKLCRELEAQQPQPPAQQGPPQEAAPQAEEGGTSP